MNPQAENLNEILQRENPHVYSLLSAKGRDIFFPAKGILAQGREARNKGINATIGMAMEDDGSPMGLNSITSLMDLTPEEIYPYAPSPGIPGLREIWKSMIHEKNPSLKEKACTTPVVCNALTHGLNMCGYLFVDPGEEIILPDLYWGNYNLVFKNANQAVFTTFPTFKGDGFNIEGLREKLLSKGDKKILVLNFPNNPTGYTPTEKEMLEICRTIKVAAERGKNIVVFCDDAYFGLVFEDGVYRESVFAALADLDEKVLAVKVDGATKEDYAWGFRVGFITYGCKGLSDAMASVLENKTGGAIRASISSGPRLSQSLLMKAYSSPLYAQDKQKKYELIRERYETIKLTIRDNPDYETYFRPLPFNSGYFMCFLLNDLDGETIRQVLLERYDTGVIAMGRIIRIAYSALDRRQIPLLTENLYQACKGCENE